MTQPTEANSKFVDKLGNFQLGNRQSAITDVVATAGGVWSAGDIDAVNENKTAMNSLLAAMREHGLIAD